MLLQKLQDGSLGTAAYGGVDYLAFLLVLFLWTSTFLFEFRRTGDSLEFLVPEEIHESRNQVKNLIRL